MTYSQKFFSTELGVILMEQILQWIVTALIIATRIPVSHSDVFSCLRYITTKEVYKTP